ncbi:hypothetical protein G2W53_032656 [Senna tora]|uniref:DUF4283 domain-containing protein n=1 Tax=Senna tora TaxID=362788 RepID=A0A834SZB1_9FABA|nr:hypothetical protein G2W53_032656 [Senna tora]
MTNPMTNLYYSPESDEVYTPPSSPNVTSYSVSSQDAKPDFIIPRQGSRLTFPDDVLAHNREYWRRCLNGVLRDDKWVPAHHIAHSIKNYWFLQDAVKVVGRQKNVYLFEFDNLQDMTLWLNRCGCIKVTLEIRVIIALIQPPEAE